GLALRATGNNPGMVRSFGTSTGLTKLTGLVVANALVAFSGALVCQYQQFADVGMGIGTIIAGLASVIIGEVVAGLQHGFLAKTTGILAGSILYRLTIAFALTLGFAASDLKLLTAGLVVLLLVSPGIKKVIIGDGSHA
ncbi:MAG: ABC transporter permease, partial [Halanaerobium sp.]|nr:ABC transporter permease [Halanaerobium sp.]